ASMIASSETTRCASAVSDMVSEWVASCTIVAAWSLMSRISRSMCSSSSSKEVTVCSRMSFSLDPRSAEAAGDVVLRALFPRAREDLVRRTFLDQIAQMEERGALRHARRLLHGVGDDDDGEVLLQLVDQFLDLR